MARQAIWFWFDAGAGAEVCARLGCTALSAIPKTKNAAERSGRSRLIAHATGHMAGGHMLCGGLDVAGLVIKEKIGLEFT